MATLNNIEEIEIMDLEELPLIEVTEIRQTQNYQLVIDDIDEFLAINGNQSIFLID